MCWSGFARPLFFRAGAERPAVAHAREPLRQLAGLEVKTFTPSFDQARHLWIGRYFQHSADVKDGCSNRHCGIRLPAANWRAILAEEIRL